jgi:hypothetical protein
VYSGPFVYRRIPTRMYLHVNSPLSACKTVQRSGWDYADLIKHQCARKDRKCRGTVLTT